MVNKLKKNKIMKGGSLSQNEQQQLLNSGFSEYQIELLNNLNVSFDEIMQHYDEISNQDSDGYFGNSDDLTVQVTNDLINQSQLNNSNISNIPQDQNDQHFMDVDDGFDSQGSLHLSDLDASSQDSSSGYTTSEDFSQGGKKTKKRRNKSKSNKIKKNKTKKSKKIKRTKKTKKSKKMRGGQDEKPQEGSLRLYKDENPQF